mmetsp:Transcript_76079/g.126809  ORF Transcript_76079/g.126809 Transcript_76079/m.126809 type:complete len:212 (+) Transcript_76079:137-772(+)|eukprot:CAMPEP_0119319918 /NCGR_PEP_ID=MMETSP1333-20130426/50807_1 /TAXON_ID=418940 /ORGANISM="Scyphosphaera apsteinii, Strain RCC1455" /LENGTH=211 /DNA_ID=CAMNT_0007326469 /DNA_START=135 /DNA_END=770 /DNA_ORIENTATION=+
MANYQLTTEQLNFLTVKQLGEWQSSGRQYILVDTRARHEFIQGTIPSAVWLPATEARGGQSKASQEQCSSLVAHAAHSDLVFVSATCEAGRPKRESEPACVAFTLDLLFFMGVLSERMFQLLGGVEAWTSAGGVLEPAATAITTRVTLPSLLEEAGLGHLAQLLQNETLETCHELVANSRIAFLNRLKGLGVVKLAERQKLATVVAKSQNR